MDGCVECSNENVCLDCDVGYFVDILNGNNSCLLCSDFLEGCSICSSSSSCL